MMRDFDFWLAQMRKSINTYSFYVDFDKVYANVEAMKIELNILNSLIGSQNVEKDIRFIFEKYPETLKCIPTLLAVRQNEIYAQDEEGAFLFNFTKPNYTIDEYIMFMRKTGLLNLISEHIVNNLVDYALGIETGLDSNGRKNRGGHQMENLVELYLKKANVEYYKEMYLTEVESKWDIDLSAISAEGTTTKRWDFVVKTHDKIYVIETNFYSAGGSKLNETSRSYKMIAEEAKTIPNFEFMWITDGGGWRSARRNLAETFNVMEHIYNITDMENGIFDKVFH
ncbi:type II restriction endonuclease [Enterococcus cecorum]|uniref:Type-2 restriction enzyme n=1 Tax=Enterococcus cecorum TaxID=44008 RepID=A0AAW9JJ14_9ENTE|nr:type II restriction endonuclease [Enterococcus cecorum]MDZ5504335.1 type II restriction endonuclease [Enterococcus cecorum]MDZ5531814.1 type II restriction endonuclease [Enterococcus cecorum]MDZ5545268.1 type II restriction endonuclease [Enterococcus cecorum]MDZ5550154.1 type II restriction endonuclease [Enterococcus cecorum]MDZ5552118.1 type II restriction endonuclease [Enterococcus cecorum]